MKLRLEVRDCDGVTLVHCIGRITYRNEAATLSKTVTGLLPRARCLVLDLGGVERIDSAGLGEFGRLVYAHSGKRLLLQAGFATKRNSGTAAAHESDIDA